MAGCTSVTVARHEAIHLVSSAIVKRCEPVNITRLRCNRLFAAASCCRRSSFSATSDARERNCPPTNPTRAPSTAAEYQEEEARGAGSARFQSSQDGCTFLPKHRAGVQPGGSSVRPRAAMDRACNSRLQQELDAIVSKLEKPRALGAATEQGELLS